MLLISVVCGALYYAEVRYAFLRLRELEAASGNALPEEMIWEALPGNVVNFWPALIFGRGSFVRSITNYYPVSVKVDIAGWGRFKVTVTPLEIFLAVSWNSKRWWLSSDGRMWPAALQSSVKVRGIEYPDKPILAWDSQLPTPIDTESGMGDIYPSNLPLAKIKKWYDTIDKIEWNKDIYCLMAKKTEGRQVVQIMLGNEERITGDILVRDDVSGWLSLAAALRNGNIYPGAAGKTPVGLSVNATYADMKFIVSTREM
jgi:hypothetical protein